ncbi:MAG: HK97 family phage prohead protease [Candidatus Heimdallarchaeaceae archaeon]
MDKFKASDMIGNMRFAVDGADLENFRIPVILSDESEVVRYSWSDGKYFLTLKHGEDNVDLSRKDILSLFVNHNTYELPIGKFEDVRIEDNKLKAWAVFDEDDDMSMKIFKKLSKGFLQSFSVGISVITKELVKEDDGVKYYDVTKWGIDEASVVGIPAIPTAKVGLEKEDEENNGVNRNQALAKNQNSKEGISMEFTKEKFEALKAENAEALKKGISDASAESTKLEKDRCSGIIALGGNAEFTKKAIDENSTVGDAAIALLKEKGADLEKKKTDFEKASEEAASGDEANKTDETLSEEQKLTKKADEALDEHFNGGK